MLVISPDDPTTSAQNTLPLIEYRYDRIVGRQVRKSKVFYEVLPATQFGFSASSSIFEEPSTIAPFNIAKFEYEYHNRSESVFPIPGTEPNAQPLSIRWFGKLNEQRYFLIEYDNQTQRLIEMNDSSNTLDPVTRQFVCDNLEFYLKNNKIDIHGNEWPADPINFGMQMEPIDCVPGPSTSAMKPAVKETICSCPISRFFQRAKPKLCLSKLESLIRRKKPDKVSSRKKCHHSDSSDDEHPPKKFGRHM